ncbi:MAG: hypothetical protein KAW09_10925, partial [Thermoplasmata archaeon]|nr:hypothetical protein [Thermoplasmata archaeon]
ELNNWIGEVSKVAGDIPVQIIANKVDLVADMEFDEDEVRRYSDSIRSSYVMTSAKTGENVESAFDRMARNIIDRRVEASSDGAV